MDADDRGILDRLGRFLIRVIHVWLRWEEWRILYRYVRRYRHKPPVW